MKILVIFRQLGVNQANSSKSMERLSSGMRINRAGDDAAGLAISEKMRGQIRGLKQAQRNAQDGISLIQTAEGALNEIHSILQRMRELAVQASTDTNTPTDRGEIQKEINQLAEEISRISNTTEFNTKNLMAGGLNNTFHIGANQGQNVTLTIAAMDALSLGVAAAKIATTIDGAAVGITGIDSVTEDLGAEAEVVVTVTNASATAEKGTIVGDVGFVDSSAFTGVADQDYSIKVSAVSDPGENGAKEVTAIAYSTDGGVSWVTVSKEDGGFTIDGLKITIADDASNAVDQVGTISAKAKFAEIQLKNLAGNLGDPVKVYGNQVSVVVGDGATDRTAHVTFDFDMLTGGEVSITQTVEGSTAAVVDAQGNVVAEAKVMAGINVSTQRAADKAITVINKAIETVSGERSKLGAIQNRLEHTIANLGTSAENLQAAESRIRDLDMAEEIMAFTKNNILQQAATAMLAQANMAPQSVLQLLG
ncbi:MAG: flagellin [Limnochordia bacterium]